MGVYNSQDTVAESIDSILNQTYKNWEFIICDDASTDGTYKILQRYKERYPDKFIILKNRTNRKLAYSLNKCLKVASGKYIARMDADDISLSSRIERQVEFLVKNHDFDLVGTAMIPFNGKIEHSPRIGKKIPDKYDLKWGACFAHATVVMKKEIMDDLGGYTVLPRTNRWQDWDLWIRFFAKGYKGYNLPEPLYKVREKAMEKRTFKTFLYSIKTGFYACRILHYPFRYYLLFAFKVLTALFIPRRLRFRSRYSKRYNNIKYKILRKI